ncbi:putative nucleotidyltransferase substrate binding domain-containing protein [Bacillus sp. M6-12]|uniref:putative nucleotidyltransferase substrate binding domain-containing protein n=1 Tax=Bacillus sp. M6-12 TaxID=2054166 RepID=UPI0015E10314|nr:putative nucleotidyltransferase substrate binding domain-containing protein [Bacillus sp. M6-12]
MVSGKVLTYIITKKWTLSQILSGTPIERIEQLIQKNVLSGSFGQDIKNAVNAVLNLFVRQRWQQMKRGDELTSVLHFARLTTREKEELIISLHTLRELQSKVFDCFSLLHWRV